MDNKRKENEVLRNPLIFTVPAYGFVMALYLDWLGQEWIKMPIKGKHRDRER
jgi:hypothetical protein